MSAFEGSIDEYIKSHIEHRIINHFFPNIAPWVNRCNEPVDIYCCDCHITAPTMRCSGDPQTSLGNSLTNLVSILASYMYATPDGEEGDIVAWVEGDDSLVAVPPTWKSDELTRYMEGFIKMGFSTKMVVEDFVGDAGYCSMFFNRRGDLCPRVAQTFLDFPWNHSGHLGRGRELMHLRAMSLHATCPSQPLTWALARHYSPEFQCVARLPFNAYEAQEYERAGFDVYVHGNTMQIYMTARKLGLVPSEAERRLFEDKYHISIPDQIKIEERVLEHGVIGLIMGAQGQPNNWVYLDQLCRVDGVDIPSCRAFYDVATRSERSEEIHPHARYAPGPDGKLQIQEEHRTPVRAAETDHELEERTPLSPYQYHFMLRLRERYRRRQARRLRAWRVHHRLETASRVIRAWGVAALIIAVLVVAGLVAVAAGRHAHVPDLQLARVLDRVLDPMNNRLAARIWLWAHKL